MRVLFLTQFYPPESGAPQNRLSDLARRLSAHGHEVEVLTAMPNYPAGVVFDGYRGKMSVREDLDGVRVLRTWILASPGKGFLRRLAGYWSFMASSVLLGLPRVGRPDAVVVEMPPLFLGLSGWLISRLRGGSLILNVSDLWPASAVAMGVLRSPALIRLSTRLEEFLYRRANWITGQTEGIVEDIRRRFPGKPVTLITNGVDTARFRPATPEERERVRREFGLDGKFVVGYAGLHGHAQGLESLVEAARLLEGRSDVVFAFFGDGPRKPDLMAAAASMRNVIFAPGQPASRMREVLSTFDAAVVPLRRLALFRGALPSKMFEAMAAGLPIVLGVEGEAQRVVENAGAGICVGPENAEALAAAVATLQQDPAARRRMGEAGRQYVAARYNREAIGSQFERLVRAAARGETALQDPLPAAGGGGKPRG